MKAIDVLEWICRESIEGEMLNIIDIPKDGDNEWEQNEEWWVQMFGNCPPHSIPEGRYLYYYKSGMTHYEMYDSRGEYVAPDAMIEVSLEHGLDYIYLYRLED